MRSSVLTFLRGREGAHDLHRSAGAFELHRRERVLLVLEGKDLLRPWSLQLLFEEASRPGLLAWLLKGWLRVSLL